MGRKVVAPAKILWTLRYKETKCPHGRLKTPTSTGRVCKRKTGRHAN